MISTTEAAFFSDSLSSTANPSIRGDGRTPFSYRPINLIDHVSLQSNGSARCQLKTSSENIVTDVIVGCKLEVEQRDFDTHGAKIECSVDFPPAALIALPYDPAQLYTSHLNMIYGPLAFSKQLRISSTHSWVIYIDAVVISASAGNAMDVICMAVHRALCNLKLPKTAEVGYQRTKSPDVAPSIEIETSSSILNDNMVEETGIQGLLRRNRSSKGKSSTQAFDFELKDTDAEHGDQLSIKSFIPIVITINLIDQKMFLDATLDEESISSNRLILAYTEGGKKIANVIQTGVKSEIGFDLLRSVIREGATIAGDLSKQL
ncbi:hypothetical protein PtA15_13A154 [Puccinia triticina]|uniref:Ribosomal RNA-processing protein 42 n=1 Tax=Puccinia triticina TaxID=208348 RepID=A0ABY7D429_9BASI|nr:uncharacterized protein PtA15_13A154 [Puccinia triticina]WAQ90755.1 hypothetical protein PtA15_13A154 [Puccinia triticina]WAR60939.1 hypothetical protein PtB15_13B190 [Puccinia triticina]